MRSTDIPDFEGRVGALIRDLNNLLRLNLREEKPTGLSLNAVRVLKAVREAAELAEEEGRKEHVPTRHQGLQQCQPRAGTLTWYELQMKTKLSSDKLGLALNELLPRHLKTRDDGTARYYFLPERERILLQQRRGRKSHREAA